MLLAQSLLNALTQIDKKSVVQLAISQGKRGPDIGGAVREAEIKSLRVFLAESKTENERVALR